MTRVDSRKFVADKMHGDVARWLRILGYDCEFVEERDAGDDEVLRMASVNGRTLLTGDRDLALLCIRRDVPVVFIETHLSLKQKLARVVESNSLKIGDETDPRCTVCNGELERTRHPDRDDVPPKVQESHDTFWVCKDCGKTYWEGTHWDRIREVVAELGSQ